MARSNENIVMAGASGKLGTIVFRQKAGKTVISRSPKPRTLAPTAAQLQIQGKFKLAAAYAKTVMLDPVRKDAYKAMAKPGQSAFNVAFSDYFKAPTISAIDTASYTGLVGDLIKIKSTDGFKVVAVKVKIEHADGSLIETGNAVLATDGSGWKYTATQANAVLAGTKVIVTASDTPGNETVQTKTLV